MSTLNSQVSALLGIGADAMDNMFDVRISLPGALSNILTNKNAAGLILPSTDATESAPRVLSIRCQGFDPPKFTAKTYDSRYKTIGGIKRFAGRIEGDRTFKLQFRLDAYYSVYRLLQAWKNAYMQSYTGYAGTNLETTDNQSRGFFGGLEIYVLDTPIAQATDTKYNKAGVTSDQFYATMGTSEGIHWKFDDIWVLDVDEPSFKTNGGDAQIISATFGFRSFMDPSYIDYLEKNPSAEALFPSLDTGDTAGTGASPTARRAAAAEPL